jgi:hypothetical protein
MAKTALKSLADIDGRTVAARQARDLAKQIETDLGGDLSAAQYELVTRVALLSAFLADCEARWLAGGDVDISAWLSAVDRQRRLLATLGLERRARDALTLGDLWRQEHAAKMVAAAAEREARANEPGNQESPATSDAKGDKTPSEGTA